MISVAFFLAGAVEVTTLLMAFCCLAGEDADDPEMWQDARKVFFIGTAAAVLVGSFHYW